MIIDVIEIAYYDAYECRVANANAWRYGPRLQINLQFTQPGRPMQNGYVERFNGSFRKEILDAHIFGSLDEVRDLAHLWMTCYNDERPHDALGGIPPSQFREQQTNTDLTNTPKALGSLV